jgi:hypothetical protein
VRAVDAAVDAGAGVTSVAALSNSPAALDAFLMQFAERAVPTLLQCWLECAPSEPRAAAELVAHARRARHRCSRCSTPCGERTRARLSRGQLAAEWRRRFLRSSEQYVFVHFPMLAPETSDGNGVDNVDEPRLAVNVAVARNSWPPTCHCRPTSSQRPQWLGAKLLPFLDSALQSSASSRAAGRRWRRCSTSSSRCSTSSANTRERRSFFVAFARTCSARCRPTPRAAKRTAVAMLHRIVERTSAATPDAGDLAAR